jgi:hypothetical protein
LRSMLICCAFVTGTTTLECSTAGPGTTTVADSVSPAPSPPIAAVTSDDSACSGWAAPAAAVPTEVVRVGDDELGLDKGLGLDEGNDTDAGFDGDVDDCDEGWPDDDADTDEPFNDDPPPPPPPPPPPTAVGDADAAAAAAVVVASAGFGAAPPGVGHPRIPYTQLLPSADSALMMGHPARFMAPRSADPVSNPSVFGNAARSSPLVMNCRSPVASRAATAASHTVCSSSVAPSSPTGTGDAAAGVGGAGSDSASSARFRRSANSLSSSSWRLLRNHAMVVDDFDPIFPASVASICKLDAREQGSTCGHAALTTGGREKECTGGWLVTDRRTHA